MKSTPFFISASTPSSDSIDAVRGKEAAPSVRNRRTDILKSDFQALVQTLGKWSILLFVSLHSNSWAQIWGDPLVTIKSEAEQVYLKALELSGDVRPSFHLVNGGMLDGDRRDRTLESFEYERIARSVSSALIEKHYRPSRSVERSDLLILVVWGATLEEGLGKVDIQYPGFGGKVIKRQRWVPYFFYNAALTGMLNGLATRTQLNSDRQELFRMSSEHRYFAIVRAFDNRWYQKTGNLECLWTTRMSAYGGNLSFSKALPAMISVGGEFFGTNLDGLATKRSDIKEWVEMPEIEIIEWGTKSGR